jgi:hypothetical protein
MRSSQKERSPLATSGLVALVAALVVAGVAVAAPTATAVPKNELRADEAKQQSCFAGRLAGRAVDTKVTTATVTGVMQARLAGGGDWDLAVYDGRTGAVVAGSAGYRTDELAEGFVTKGQSLVIQGCRYRGTADRAVLAVEFFAESAVPTKPKAAEPVQIVSVSTPQRSDKERLVKLGLDLTEHGTATSLEVVVRGPKDLSALRSASLKYSVKIADLASRTAGNKALDKSYAAKIKSSALPSGRTSYRRLFDYELELKQLTIRYPNLVQPLVLPHQTSEGRDVSGIEITNNAPTVADGKPVFLNMGVHHAREWPAAEHPLEFAYDIIRSHWTDPKIRDLVAQVRTVIVPVVNPDGFNVSREAPSIGGDFSTFDYEYKRKTCKASDSPAEFRGGTCGANLAGRTRGTDPNRNYGGFWGGPGASALWSSDTYRGNAPFSTPEVRNVRDFISSRQVTNLITNHTYSNLLLRPPGVAAVGAPLDEPQVVALADSMARHNKYLSQPSYGLYDTTGSTEDWSFWNTGGLGYTFEIGPDEFHPPYQNGVVAEYAGLKPAAGAGKGGNRAAYFEMLKATADQKLHATIEGTAPAGAVLRVHKEFTTPTSPVIAEDGSVGRPLHYTDVLDTKYVAPGGRFNFSVNPSTRPYVAGRAGRLPTAPTQAPIALSNPAAVPAENQGDPLTGTSERIPFTINGPPAADNGSVSVSIDWGQKTTDWDLYLLNAAGEIVGTSAQGDTTNETAKITDPPPGNYTAVIVNFAGGAASDWTNGSVKFAKPIPPVYGPKETWSLTCERPDGSVRGAQSVFVDRGQVVDVADVCRPGSAKK